MLTDGLVFELVRRFLVLLRDFILLFLAQMLSWIGNKGILLVIPCDLLKEIFTVWLLISGRRPAPWRVIKLIKGIIIQEVLGSISEEIEHIIDLHSLFEF